MVSIDEITEDINKALGEEDLPTPTTEREDTGIPKSVCSNGRPDRSFVALHVTSGRLSNAPDGGPDDQDRRDVSLEDITMQRHAHCNVRSDRV